MRRAAAAGALLLFILLLTAAGQALLSRGIGPMRALAEDCLAAPDAARAQRPLGALAGRWERFEPLARLLAGRGRTEEVRRALAALEARIGAGGDPADWAGEAAVLRELLEALR